MLPFCMRYESNSESVSCQDIVRFSIKSTSSHTKINSNKWVKKNISRCFAYINFHYALHVSSPHSSFYLYTQIITIQQFYRRQILPATRSVCMSVIMIKSSLRPLSKINVSPCLTILKSTQQLKRESVTSIILKQCGYLIVMIMMSQSRFNKYVHSFTTNKDCTTHLLKLVKA